MGKSKDDRLRPWCSRGCTLESPNIVEEPVSLSESLAWGVLRCQRCGMRAVASTQTLQVHIPTAVMRWRPDMPVILIWTRERDNPRPDPDRGAEYH